MSTIKFLTADAKKPAGFFEFVKHKNCFLLVTRDGKVHYGSCIGLTSMNWADAGIAYEYRRTLLPKGYDLKGLPAPANSTNKLLICPAAKH